MQNRMMYPILSYPNHRAHCGWAWWWRPPSSHPAMRAATMKTRYEPYQGINMGNFYGITL